MVVDAEEAPDGVDVVPQELWNEALAAFPTERKIELAKELADLGVELLSSGGTARAIADVVGEERVNATVIVPSVFDARVAPAVAAAVRAAAQRHEVAARLGEDGVA